MGREPPYYAMVVGFARRCAKQKRGVPLRKEQTEVQPRGEIKRGDLERKRAGTEVSGLSEKRRSEQSITEIKK